MASDLDVKSNISISNKRFGLVGILLLTLLIAFLDRVNISVLVADKSFLNYMGIAGNSVNQGLLMTIFLIAYGFSNVILSPLGDVLGPRKAMSLAILFWVLAMFLGGVVTAFSALLMTRFLLGIGEGMHWPMQSKFIKYWFPPNERGKANSVWLIGLMLGPAFAMPFFTWLVSIISWRTSFFVLFLFGLIPLGLIWFFTTDHPHENKRISKTELELIESGLQAERQQEGALDETSVWGNIKAFSKNYRFWLVTIWYCAQASMFWGVLTWLPSYLKVARGFSWQAMGVWSSFPYILGTLSILLIGWLSDKVGRRAPFMVFGHLLAGIFIYSAALTKNNTVAAILLSFGVASISVGLPAVWTLVLEIVPNKAAGTGSGIVNGVGNAFSAFAPVIMGYFIDKSGYVGGLMYLVLMAIIGVVTISILALQKY